MIPILYESLSYRGSVGLQAHEKIKQKRGL